MVSIIIPSRNEIYLEKTIRDILKKAQGEVEVIAICDGYWPAKHEIVEDPRVKYIHFGTSRGMRNGINAGALTATGDYLMKVDAHCMFDVGFDVKLAADMEDNWLVVPRRKRLDAENWTIKDVGKPDVDYEFLSYPYWKPDQVGIHGTIWKERILERLNDPKYDIDEDMSFQGSCWFVNRKYFMEHIFPMQEEGYETFIGEPQEIGLKYWLGGGKQMRNKKTWYAHLHKGKEMGRGYFMDKRETRRGNAYSVSFWMNMKPGDGNTFIHDIDWLVDRFWPVPTWPDNWREIMPSIDYEDLLGN